MKILTILRINGSRSPATDTVVTPSFDESRKKAGENGMGSSLV